MFHSLATLVKLQLSEKLKWKQDASTAYKAAQVAKRIGYMGVAYGLFTVLFLLLFKILQIQPEIEMFIFFIFFLQLVSIITCIVQGSQILYTSKDNSLLLTYPVKHEMVFVSKILVMYIIELLKSLTLVFPLLMAYATMAKGLLTANYVIGGLFYSIILPLMPVLIGAIISIPFVFLTKILKKASWVKGIFSLILFGGLIALTVLLVRVIQANSPIRIVALFNSFLDGMTAFFIKVNKFSLYCNFVGKALYLQDTKTVVLNHVYMIASLIGTAVISVLISMPTFFKLASSASENAVTKKHKGVNKTHKSTFFTFFRKETTLSIRNIGNFASDYVFLFAMPIILILLTCVFVNIDRKELGLSLTYGCIGLVSLVLLCASNTASATAISSEGSEFVLLKTAPGKSSNIIWSKLLVNFIISIVMTTISFILVAIVLIPDVKKGLLDLGRFFTVYGYVCIIEGGLLLWSIQLDIVNPKLREFANSQNKAEIKNSSQSIIIGLIFSVLFSAILLLLFVLTIPLYLSAIILIFIALVFLGLRFYFLLQYRDAYFEDIQL